VRRLRALLPGKAEDEDTGKIYFTHVSCKLRIPGLRLQRITRTVPT